MNIHVVDCSFVTLRATNSSTRLHFDDNSPSVQTYCVHEFVYALIFIKI